MACATAQWFGTALSFTPVFLFICCVDAASFQYYQLPQKDSDYRLKNMQRFPSPEMVKALEYIENLRQQSNKGVSIPDYNSFQGAPFLLQKGNSDWNRFSDNLKDPLNEDESQWLRIMLEALMQADKEAKTPSKANNKLYSLTSGKSLPAELSDDYETNKLPERKHKNLKMPRGYYEESSRDSPFKRTNEIVEEQYTPQSLATLESVFQELGKLTGPTNHKREEHEEDQKFYKDDEDGTYKANNIAYEDVAGGEDWNPIEEKLETETQEEIKDSKEEIEKNEEEIDDDMKRSEGLESQDDVRKEHKEQQSENLSRLMNYYLKMLRLVNKFENSRPQSGQTEEKRAARVLEREIDPRVVYQLIDISRKLQIPPEDLIDMLRAGDNKKPVEKLETDQEPELPEDLDEISNPALDQINLLKNKANSKNGYLKESSYPILENLPEDLTIEDVVNILGTENLQNRKPDYSLSQLNLENSLPRSSFTHGRPKGYKYAKAPWINDLDRRQVEHEAINDKDEELADYLAKMLSKYPEVMAPNQIKRIPMFVPTEDELQEDEQYDKGIKEYLTHEGSHEVDRLAPVIKRFSKTRENDDTQNKEYLDEDMLMKVLEYLNQEKVGKGKDHNVNRAMGSM
nr:secretogranin-2 isoform X2 [Geotrypetes seraphini]XP_033815245.1 secretogranin-2 isoform X2 [Geotrypetes seraphini]XP_033815246.1 secretogranin-2 isoform X2 [Geotrypetes seraphini]